MNAHADLDVDFIRTLTENDEILPKNCKHRFIFNNGHKSCVLCGYAELAIYFREQDAPISVHSHQEKVSPFLMKTIEVMERFNSQFRKGVVAYSRIPKMSSQCARDFKVLICSKFPFITMNRFEVMMYACLLYVFERIPVRNLAYKIKSEIKSDLAYKSKLMYDINSILPELNDLQQRYNPLKHVFKPQEARKYDRLVRYLVVRGCSVQLHILWAAIYKVFGGDALYYAYIAENNLKGLYYSISSVKYAIHVVKTAMRKGFKF